MLTCGTRVSVGAGSHVVRALIRCGSCVCVWFFMCCFSLVREQHQAVRRKARMAWLRRDATSLPCACPPGPRRGGAADSGATAVQRVGEVTTRPHSAQSMSRVGEHAKKAWSWPVRTLAPAKPWRVGTATAARRGRERACAAARAGVLAYQSRGVVVATRQWRDGVATRQGGSRVRSLGVLDPRCM